MKKLFFILLALSLAVVGCGQRPENASGQEAITAVKAMETAEEQVNYLLKEAELFYDSEDFQDAINIAQYILSYLDSDSQSAQDLLEKAKEALAAQIKQEAIDLDRGIKKFGK